MISDLWLAIKNFFRFQIMFHSEEDGKLMGFRAKTAFVKYAGGIFDTQITVPKNVKRYINCTLIIVDEIEAKMNVIEFKRFKLFKKATEVTKYMKSHCPNIFKEMKADGNDLISFSLDKKANCIRMDDNLAKYLGFDMLQISQLSRIGIQSKETTILCKSISINYIFIQALLNQYMLVVFVYLYLEQYGFKTSMMKGR